MTRIMTPTPTRGPAPSHSPPDTRYAPGISLARGLGWFSIGLGLAELLEPEAMADLTGVRSEGLLRAYGVREIVTALGILGSSRPARWVWGRVAGDALDIATLLTPAASDDGDRGRALIATAAVAGVTLLDALCATQLTAAAALEG
jgi:hypothetical protein